jgi:hypothetical protein
MELCGLGGNCEHFGDTVHCLAITTDGTMAAGLKGRLT